MRLQLSGFLGLEILPACSKKLLEASRDMEVGFGVWGSIPLPACAHFVTFVFFLFLVRSANAIPIYGTNEP